MRARMLVACLAGMGWFAAGASAATYSGSIDAPSTVFAGDDIPVTMHFAADTPRQLFVTAQPATAGDCASTYAQRPQSATNLSGSGVGSSDPIGDADTLVGSKTYHLLASKSTRVCAWIALDPTANSDFGPVSALVKVKPAPPARVYKGKTSQHLPFRIAIQAGRVLQVYFKQRYHCPRPAHFNNGHRWDGTYTVDLTSANFGDLRLDETSRFAAKLDGNKDNRVDFSGKLTGKSVTGIFSATARANAIIGGRATERCRTGRVRFSARRK